MEETQKIYCFSQLHELDQPAIRAAVYDWLILSRLLFEPTEMQIDGLSYPFDSKRLEQKIASLSDKEDGWLKLKNQENEASLHLLKTSILEKILVTQEVYTYWETVLTDYIEERLRLHGFFGYVRSYDEYLYHNTSQIADRKMFESEEAIAQLPKMKAYNGEVVVDCNVFPGYDVFYNGFCLTSCWHMFFGEAYKEIFPKQLLFDVQQIERVEELGDGVFVELYKDPFRWEKAANLKFQDLFREQLGIPQLSYTNGVGALKQPYTEFSFDKSLIQTVQYQDESYQPTEKNNAYYFVTRTYDLLSDHYQVRRMKGSLNVLAYFPWVDDREKKLLNYHVIHPEMTLDNGVKAYEYYIRDCIDAAVADQRLQEYTAILQFFVPKTALLDFPLEELRNKLADMVIRQVKQIDGTVKFLLEKEKNHLKVEFIDQNEMKQRLNN